MSKAKGVKIKSWNFLVGCVGVPGTGKSYRASQRVLEEARATSAYVIAHDPNGTFDDPGIAAQWKGYGGVHRHESVAVMERALASNPAGIHVVDVLDGGELMTSAVKIGAASMARAKDGFYHPTILLLDEAVGAEGVASSRGIGRDWLDAIVSRRHKGIGIAWTAQSTFVAHRMLIMQARELYLFRCVDPADEKRLAAVGITREDFARIRALPDRKCLTVKAGRVESKNT